MSGGVIDHGCVSVVAAHVPDEFDLNRLRQQKATELTVHGEVVDVGVGPKLAVRFLLSILEESRLPPCGEPSAKRHTDKRTHNA